MIPLMAAVLYAAALAQYKWLVSRFELNVPTFLTIHFLILFGLSALLQPVYGGIDPALFQEPRYLALLLILVGLGFGHNLFLVKGLRRESLHEYELIDLLMPIFTVTLAAIAFVDERDPIRLSLAIFASSAFLVTHLKRTHVTFKQADRWLIFAVFLLAIERILVKPLLFLAEPATLYFIRAGLISLMLLVVFRPKLPNLPLADWLWLTLNAIVGGLAIVLIWTSTALFGVVVTELYMLIVPMLLAIFSVIWMKEHWSFRQGLAFGVIIASITLINLLP